MSTIRYHMDQVGASIKVAGVLLTGYRAWLLFSGILGRFFF